MAAPEAAWNRLDVPWPASSATVALPTLHPAVRSLLALRRRCYLARKRLSGTQLAAEGRVLRAVLYVYHSKLCRHRSYLAMQQVEQCLKRLWKMNLVGCLETLSELVPKKNTHAECLIPSQPMLETVALKVLGGCKLILRLLDCCCKAFLLSVNHLCSEEYILLNTVASGLLSRLWIQYRCALQNLMSLYGLLSTSLQLVSETQQMPYIKGFTFPSDISNFLGINVSTEMKKHEARMLTTRKSTSWLKKLFPAVPAAPETEKKRNFATCMSAVKKRGILCPVDIGEPVLVTRANRGKHQGFDVKSLLRQPSRQPAQEGISIASMSLKAKSASLSSLTAKSQHAGSLVQIVQTATSFGELSEALRKAILWCKGNRFKSEAYFLRSKLLKSNRLHHVEAQGCSLKKKLCCVKTSVCKCLLYGSRNTRWPKQYLWAQFCRRRRKSSTCFRRRQKTAWQKPSELLGVCENSPSLILPAYHNGPSGQEGCSNADTGSVRLSTAGTLKQLLLEGTPGPGWKEATENMDIDSIFAAMGV
ncbi:nucleolus and neural progenitor protein [Dryobates pubescens]|uniref:nucleolus and neural progenitor protein n=1 Tax=Dryobates pubescens TaxID=118200 RepID=UPI0023B8DD2F|nr:nucleolus and neural progenitor protein [Dryobates pubescens]